MADHSQPLTEAGLHARMIVRRVDSDDRNEIRLKRLGICEGKWIHVIQSGDPLIIQVAGCRIGISRHLACNVHVVPCTTALRKSKTPKNSA